jgi:hypothetical protein
MDKAILVIDMPDKCWKCPICASYQTSAFSIREYWCTANENEDVDPDKKPDWCPLREMPKKKLPYLTSSDHLIGFGEGYNACINDILGD